MSRTTAGLSDALQSYIVEHAVKDGEVEQRLREDTGRMPNAHLQIAPEQAQMMSVFARMVNARIALEIGVFTGYSALAVARALPDDGRLFAFEINAEYAEIAKGYWEDAGVADKIDVRLGPALENLPKLLDEGYRGKVDFAFIDADKTAYPEYYELVMELLRPGGVVLIDNVFRNGNVADASANDEATVATRELNRRVSEDIRVDSCIIPIADGVTVARKR